MSGEENSRKCNLLFNIYKDEFKKVVESKKLSFAYFSLGRPHNMLTVIDATSIYYVLGHNNAVPGMVSSNFQDFTGKGILNIDLITKLAVRDLGYREFFSFQLPKTFLDMDDSTIRQNLETILTKNFTDEFKRLNKPRAVQGFTAIQPYLDNFSDEHPHYEKNVLIMMRIKDEEPYNTIGKVIRETLRKYGLFGLRADDKVYPSDDDLWNNVCVYMMGCKFGIAVFDNFDQQEYSHNVSLEYGFMRACDKRVLILKEKSITVYPSDIIGKLYKPFNKEILSESVQEQIELWLKDIGIIA